MKIALAAPPFPQSIVDGLCWLDKLVKEAADREAEIVCFPESFIPGYPGMGYPKEERTADHLQDALNKACAIAAKNTICIILPMDWPHPEGFLNVAFVISSGGIVLGYQAKNQLDPSEDTFWIPGTQRTIFEVNGVKFAITICHEGFRYPESVRWAACNQASLVFHPHFNGSNTNGAPLTEWGHKNNPYYEKAAMLRAMENTIYFASCNYASQYPESASSVIDPTGNCMVHAAYGKTGVIIATINPALATGLLAKRFKPENYL